MGIKINNTQKNSQTSGITGIPTKITRYKINKQKSIVLLHMSSKQVENKIFKMLLIVIAFYQHQIYKSAKDRKELY